MSSSQVSLQHDFFTRFPCHPPQSKSAVADFDHFIEWPKPAYTRFRLGEGRTAEGSPGFGDGGAAHDGDASYAEAPSPPPGALARADLPPAEPRYSEGSATQRSDRSRQQPTSVGGGGAWLELTVRDDGFGIAADQAPGFGLRGMQERVQALGGEFAIEAGNGCGTCVRIVIPLPLPLPSRYPLPDHAGSSP